MEQIGIIGGGAWGTVLALIARKTGRSVVLWAHEPEVVASINDSHVNDAFLPGVTLDPEIRATSDPLEAVASDVVFLATPAQHLRRLCERVRGGWKRKVPAIICAKGIEQNTGLLMSEVVSEVLPQAPIAVLSGPTFAIEVAHDLPTAVTAATEHTRLGTAIAENFSTGRFRIYRSKDPVGAQIGGAVKNVMAIGCGIVEGRELGDNARAAMMTRGLAEIVRLGAAKGAQTETMMGLSGVGDLILTSASMQSRNFSLGFALGRGEKAADILAGRRSVAEGVYTASSVNAMAARLGVDMPICLAVDAVLHHGADVDRTIASLLARPLKAETSTETT